MKLNLNSVFTSRFLGLVVSTLLLTTMVACGGGTGSAGAPLGPGPGAGSIAVVFLDKSGNSISDHTLHLNTPYVVSATVADASDTKVSNTIVSFSINPSTLGTLSPSPATALTNALGQATVTLTPTTTGVGVLTAAATFAVTHGAAPTIVTSTIDFQVIP